MSRGVGSGENTEQKKSKGNNKVFDEMEGVYSRA